MTGDKQNANSSVSVDHNEHLFGFWTFDLRNGLVEPVESFMAKRARTACDSASLKAGML
jgi:hypothetical protein